MKKLVTTLLAWSTAPLLYAQIHFPHFGNEAPPASPAVLDHGVAKVYGGNCILGENFEGTDIGALTAAGWSIGAQVQRVDGGGPVDAWRIADAANGGDAYLPIPDDPQGNHFIVANDASAPCDCNMDSVALATPSIDLSGQSHVRVLFRAYAGEVFGGAPLRLYASGDGGGSWALLFTVPAVNDVFQELDVDLSAYDGNANTKLAWCWSDNGTASTGVAIDDICIAPTPANDLSLLNVYSADITQPQTAPAIEYTLMPVGQARGIELSAVLRNNGLSTQTNVVATAHLFLDGAPVPGTFTSPVLASLAPDLTDTLVIQTNWTPAQPGQLTMDVDVTATQPDGDPTDNSGHSAMRVTGPSVEALFSQWGVDDGHADNFRSHSTHAYRVGNMMRAVPPGSVAYGIYVAFGSFPADSTVEGDLFEVSGNSFVLRASSAPFRLEPWMQDAPGDTLMIYIPFSEPYALSPNSYVMPTLSTSDGTEVEYATSGTSFPQTSFFWTENSWYHVTSTPMVRLGLTAAPPTAQGPPSNNDCSGAVELIPGSSCNSLNGSTLEADAAPVNGPCGDSDVDADVWYVFTALDTAQTIIIQGYNGFDAVIELFGGDCGLLTPLACGNATSAQGTTESVADSLAYDQFLAGGTYYFRVYDHNPETEVPVFATCMKRMSASQPSGLSDLASDHLGIFPTPTEGTIHVTTDLRSEHAQVSLIDMLGRTLWAQHLSFVPGETRILSFGDELAPGEYLLRISDHMRMIQGRVIIQ